MILNKKNDILNWLEKNDAEYIKNIQNNYYEFIGIDDISNQALLNKLIKKDNLSDDYFEEIKKEGHHYIINVKGNIDISSNKLEIIPIQFYHVEGYFDCSSNQLTSLKGCPQIVNDHFDCGNNDLKSLKGCPHIVGESFYCHSNELSSLKGCPSHVHGSFSCSHNQLTSLEYSPQIIGSGFYCQNNQLTSLKYSPQIVGNHFICSNNLLTSLEYFPDIVTQGVYLVNNLKLLKYKSQSNESRIQNMSDDEFLQELDFKFWHQFHLQEKIMKENSKIIDDIKLDDKIEKNQSIKTRIKKV